jgi:hypothetical protein
MNRVLQDIIIFYKSGKIIKSAITNLSIKKDNLAFILCALTSFSKSVFNQKLKSFNTGKFRIDFIKKNNFYFVATSLSRTKHKKSLKNLNQISEKFFNQYPKIKLNQWDGCTNIFNDFDPNILKTNNEIMCDYIKNHWRD